MRTHVRRARAEDRAFGIAVQRQLATANGLGREVRHPPIECTVVDRSCRAFAPQHEAIVLERPPEDFVVEASRGGGITRVKDSRAERSDGRRHSAGLYHGMRWTPRAMMRTTSKAAMKMLGRDTGALRLPMTDAAPATLTAVRQALTAAGLA